MLHFQPRHKAGAGNNNLIFVYLWGMVKIHTGGDVLWQSPRTQCYYKYIAPNRCNSCTDSYSLDEKRLQCSVVAPVYFHGDFYLRKRCTIIPLSLKIWKGFFIYEKL